MKRLLLGLLALLGMGSNSKAIPPDQPARELRTMALQLQPADVGISRSDYPYEVYGLLMETGLADGDFYSLVAVADGTATLYYGNGGGMTGGGEQERVREATSNLLMGADHFREQAAPVSEYPEPSGGETSFYFLTFDGVKSYRAKEEVLGEGRDALSGLFFLAHKVIAELRRIEQASGR